MKDERYSIYFFWRIICDDINQSGKSVWRVSITKRSVRAIMLRDVKEIV